MNNRLFCPRWMKQAIFLFRGEKMLRLLLSIIIVTLLVTYAMSPAFKDLKRFFKSEWNRLLKNINHDEEIDE